MNIRLVSAQDTPLLETIAGEFISRYYGDQTTHIREWLDGGGHKLSFLCHDNNSAVGFVSLKKDPAQDYVKLCSLIVFPRYRGQGYHFKMLNWSLMHVQKWGYNRIIATVSEDKPDLMQFYIDNGFQLVKHLVGKYQPAKTEFVLAKTISPIKRFRMIKVHFDLMQNGAKTLECLPSYQYVKEIKPREIVQFYNEQCVSPAYVRIVDVRRYTCIKTMLQFEDYSKLLPDCLSIAHVAQRYNEYYPGDKIQRAGGVTVLELDLIYQ